MILDDAAFDIIPDFSASQFRVKAATEAWERAGAYALRRQVFCAEQQLFDADDRDALDDDALLLVAVATVAGMPDEVVGTVRIDEREPELWYGSRLAVDRRYRRVAALGPALIRLAVTTAHGRGCTRFLAHVQNRNEFLFRQLHWARLTEVELHGVPHLLMQADLAHYPVSAEISAGFTTLARRGMSAEKTAADIAAHLRDSRGFAHKVDIAAAVAALGVCALDAPIQVGDDCAAIPDGDGYLLFSIEGFVEDFVKADPYFAGYCGVMVNLSDIAAMGGRPIAVVDAVWGHGVPAVEPILAGLKQAASVYRTPVVGGHTNTHNRCNQLAVAVLGRAKNLISSFTAGPADTMLAAIDLRGAFRDPYPYWDASTQAPAVRLRDDLDILPQLADDHLVTAGKDISMAGLVGTAMMLLEASGLGGTIDLDAIPSPPDVEVMRWLTAFPSFGFLLTARAENVAAIIRRFAARGIACAAIGRTDESRAVRITCNDATATVWDFAHPFIGCRPDVSAREAVA